MNGSGTSPSMRLVIKGGQLVTADTVFTADVLIDDGAITDVGADLDAADADVVDAAGCLVFPGFVDLNTHLREPGAEEAETILTGTRSAALGGFTAILAMPDTEPAIDSPAMVRDLLVHAQGAPCDVIPTAAMTIGRGGELLAPMGELAALGVRLFCDDGAGVQDAALMRSIMGYATGLAAGPDEGHIVLSLASESASLTANTHMHEGDWSTRLGVGGQCEEAETLMVQRNLSLARLTGATVHLQHLSCARSVQLVRDAKAEGLNVTCEVTPHHLVFTDESCASYDPIYKVDPPFRLERDRQALIDGLIDGTIDAVATDHAPHEPHTKEFPFDQAPSGTLGLETAASVLLGTVGLEPTLVTRVLSRNPASIAGLKPSEAKAFSVGAPANLCVYDPLDSWWVAGANMASRSHNTAFEGIELTGRIRHTIFAGDLVVRDGTLMRNGELSA